MQPTPVNRFEWLMQGQHGGKWALPSSRFCTAFHDSNGDHAGSEANAGVGTFCSFRPVTSIV